MKTRVLRKREASGQGLDFVRAGIKLSSVGLYLVLEGVVTDTGTGINNLLNEDGYLFGVFRKAENEVTCNGGSLVSWQVHVVKLWDLVEVSKLTEGAKEVISRDGSLALEEGEPEDLGVLSTEDGANFAGQIIVHDVLKVDLVEIVSPWVQHREALVLYALGTVLLNVLLKELELSLVGVDRVAKVILVDGFLLVADEGANGLDAGAGLQVLGLDHKIEQASDFIVVAGAKLAQDANEHLLEALKVPVLVDAGVDDARVEHLLGLHGEEVAEVLHVVDLFIIVQVFGEPVGE